MYLPLWNKTNYTLLSSLLKVDSLIRYAVERRLSSMAICDDNMFGVMEFIKKCEKNGIKPVVGLELHLDEFDILLYAKNYSGYQSLMRLSTIQSERVINLEDLEKNKNSVISVLPFLYKEKYMELSSLYEDLYLGYQNVRDEKEALLVSKQVVYLPCNLYFESKDRDILPYLYRIRDGKTILDDMEYDILDHELVRDELSFPVNSQGILNTSFIAEECFI